MDKSNAERQGHRNREIGRRGEEATARYIQMLGYEVLERNWTCPAGEADIIARDGETLVFIEVKTRSDFDKGFPGEAVSQKKRQRYEKIACWYLKEYPYLDIPVRFDVSSLLVVAPNRAFIRYMKNAFGVTW